MTKRALRRKWVFLALTPLIILGFYVLWAWRDISAFRQVLASFHSKTFCSCYYVMRQSKDYCLDYSSQYLPIEDFSLDEVHKRVSTRAFGVWHSSQFESVKSGCILE